MSIPPCYHATQALLGRVTDGSQIGGRFTPASNAWKRGPHLSGEGVSGFAEFHFHSMIAPRALFGFFVHVSLAC